MKFGFNQISEKTPQFAKWIFRVTLYTAAAINIVLNTISEIPPDIKMMVGKYSLYAVTIVHAFSKLFGIEAEDPKI